MVPRNPLEYQIFGYFQQPHLRRIRRAELIMLSLINQQLQLHEYRFDAHYQLNFCNHKFLPIRPDIGAIIRIFYHSIQGFYGLLLKDQFPKDLHVFLKLQLFGENIPWKQKKHLRFLFQFFLANTA